MDKAWPEGYEWVTEWHELLNRSPFLSRSNKERLAEIEAAHAGQIEEMRNSPVAMLVAASIEADFAALSAKWSGTADRTPKEESSRNA